MGVVVSGARFFEYGRCVEHVWGWGKNGMLKKL